MQWGEQRKVVKCVTRNLERPYQSPYHSCLVHTIPLVVVSACQNITYLENVVFWYVPETKYFLEVGKRN